MTAPIVIPHRNRTIISQGRKVHLGEPLKAGRLKRTGSSRTVMSVIVLQSHWGCGADCVLLASFLDLPRDLSRGSGDVGARTGLWNPRDFPSAATSSGCHLFRATDWNPCVSSFRFGRSFPATVEFPLLSRWTRWRCYRRLAMSLWLSQRRMLATSDVSFFSPLQQAIRSFPDIRLPSPS
jgi:hypothetical protein